MLPLMLQTFLSLDTHTHTYIHVLLIKTKRILPLINKKRIQFVKRRLVPSSRTFTRKRSAAGTMEIFGHPPLLIRAVSRIIPSRIAD